MRRAARVCTRPGEAAAGVAHRLDVDGEARLPAVVGHRADVVGEADLADLYRDAVERADAAGEGAVVTSVEALLQRPQLTHVVVGKGHFLDNSNSLDSAPQDLHNNNAPS
jgi:hypothetical protein